MGGLEPGQRRMILGLAPAESRLLHTQLVLGKTCP